MVARVLGPLKVVLSFLLHTSVTGGCQHLSICKHVVKVVKRRGPNVPGEEEDVLLTGNLLRWAELYSIDIELACLQGWVHTKKPNDQEETSILHITAPLTLWCSKEGSSSLACTT
jgi:hypothetical protein